MRENQPDLPRWPPRAAPNGSIKPLLEAQESSTQVQVQEDVLNFTSMGAIFEIL